jgi:hypothetical protein
MDRNTGIALTLISILLCTCPGLVICSAGGLFATVNNSDSTLQEPILTFIGILMVFLGLLVAIIPIFVAFFTLRNKPAKRELTQADLDEVLPPPI